MNNQKLAIGVISLLGIMVFLFGTGLLITTDTPDCVFSGLSETCTVNMTLPEGKEASFYQLTLDFDKGAEGSFSAFQEVDSVHHVDSVEDKSWDTEFFDFYLYPYPTDWGEAAEVKMRTTVTGSARCSGYDDVVDLWAENNIVTIPYPENRINMDGERDCDRSDRCLVEYDEDDDGDKYTRDHNMYRLGSRVKVADCVDNEDIENTKVIEGTVGAERLQSNPTDQKFVVVLENEESNSGGNGDWRNTPPTVELAYREATYPTDVSYSIGSTSIDTLSGPQKEQVKSLDIHEQVNEACNRDADGSECVFELTFTSDKPGSLYVSEDHVYRLATPSNGNDPDPDPDTESTDVPWGIVGASFAGLLLILGTVWWLRR